MAFLCTVIIKYVGTPAQLDSVGGLIGKVFFRECLVNIIEVLIPLVFIKGVK